jgi:HD-GYP domain-containing protein (c-di-GMP phosphodiesterase class II)
VFDGIPVYLRSSSGDIGSAPADGSGQAPASEDLFRLYCAAHIHFSEEHRARLVAHGLKFVYIPMAFQDRFRQQTEAQIERTAEDPSVAISVKSEIVYETSVELMNELLAEPNLASTSPRLEKVSRAVTTLVLNDPTAFSHLFTASHHDFYTATHMVNVGTWMVPLAYAMGHHDVDELSHICQAGLLHDIGKTYISPELLNKTGKLTDEDWAILRRHPELGCTHLEQYERIHPLILTITRQHHERMDGTGYPDGITGDQMHPISKICAVVDSFDAMTAFRPFKQRTLSVNEALDILIKETPQKYDPAVMEAWIAMLRTAKVAKPGSSAAVVLQSPIAANVPAPAVAAPAPQPVAATSETDGRNLRRFARYAIHCPGRVHVLAAGADGPRERLGIPIIAHNVSQSGAGFLSQTPISLGDQVRLYLNGSGPLKKMKEGMTVRCRNYRDGWYELGINFAAPDFDDLPPGLVAA